jgi:hypothetical protein
MREVTDRERLDRFMTALAARASREARVYFTGGVTAVLHGWRASTIDVDLRFLPELDELFRALPLLKEELHINIELASPPDFIPALPGWEERSLFIRREGNVSFYHFDLYSQALAKIERGHAQDGLDVKAMIQGGLVEPDKLLELFASIEPQLYRYPAIDALSFKKSIQETVNQARGN